MKRMEKDSSWYYEPWVVLALLFLVLGPFGLPLLYRSPKFSRTAKFGITFLITLYTWVLIWAGVETVKKAAAIYSQYRGILW